MLVMVVSDAKLLRHGAEHGVVLLLMSTAELHQSQQQQRLLRSTDVTLQTAANGSYGLLCVQLFRHLVSTAHVTVQVKVEVDVADAEMMAQITDEHVLCPCLVYLLFFAKEGKQTDKAG